MSIEIRIINFILGLRHWVFLFRVYLQQLLLILETLGEFQQVHGRQYLLYVRELLAYGFYMQVYVRCAIERGVK